MSVCMYVCAYTRACSSYMHAYAQQRGRGGGGSGLCHRRTHTCNFSTASSTIAGGDAGVGVFSFSQSALDADHPLAVQLLACCGCFWECIRLTDHLHDQSRDCPIGKADWLGSCRTAHASVQCHAICRTESPRPGSVSRSMLPQRD